MIRRVVRAFVATGFALLGTGCDALVGGECAPGFAASEGACMPIRPDQGSGSVGAGSGVIVRTFEDAPGGAGGEAGEGGGGSGAIGGGGIGGAGGSGGSGVVCDEPLVECNGACVDTSSDPKNCGACGVVCDTEICVAGQCTGKAVGHLVAIGMDYSTAAAASPAVVLLGNAVFLPPGDPVRVLQYRLHAQPFGQPPSVAIASALEGEAGARGRAVKWVEDASPVALPSKLQSGEVDVLLVHDEPHAPLGLLGALGAFWAPAIESFAKSGGVVVVLATGSGTGEMGAFLTNAGILEVDGFNDVSNQPVDDVGWLDALGQNVLSPFLAKPTSSSFVTPVVPDAFTSFVVVDANDAPVAVHRVVLGD